jgi:hypothetical protein
MVEVAQQHCGSDPWRRQTSSQKAMLFGEEAASIAALHVPVDASVDVTEALKLRKSATSIRLYHREPSFVLEPGHPSALDAVGAETVYSFTEE